MSHNAKSNSVFIANGYNWGKTQHRDHLDFHLVFVDGTESLQNWYSSMPPGKARFQAAELPPSCSVPQLKHSVLLPVPANLHLIKMVALSSIPQTEKPLMWTMAKNLL